MNFFRYFILLLLMQSGVALADSTDTGRVGVGRYVTGGIVGTTLGFGIGHGLQDRYWRDYGWAFTVGGILTWFNAMTAGGGPFATYKCDEECQAERSREANRAFMWWVGFKAVETLAVWWPRNVNFEGIYAKHHEVDSRFIPISKAKYLQGGLLGTLVGFGTGHAMQGRWRRDGWQHTAWQTGTVALVTYGWFYEYPLMWFVGVPLLAVLKIVEIASVWEPSPDLYRIVSDNNQLPMFTVAPLLNTNQAGVQLVLRI